METEPCSADCFLLQVGHCRLCAAQTEQRCGSPTRDSVVQKGAKEFVDQNMLRSQRSRRRRKQQQQQQQRSSSSNCPGPSEPAEEAKQGESDHETTSSSGEGLAWCLLNLPCVVGLS